MIKLNNTDSGNRVYSFRVLWKQKDKREEGFMERVSLVPSLRGGMGFSRDGGKA